MGIKRADLDRMLSGVENKDEIINYVMAENGKTINENNAKYEELKTEKDTIAKELADLKELTKDYESLKSTNQSLQSEVDNFKSEKSNQEYLDAMKKCGIDDAFIDKYFIDKIGKGNDLKEFEANAQKFLRENPRYGKETFNKISTPNPGEGEFDFANKSDAEILDYLRSQHRVEPSDPKEIK